MCIPLKGGGVHEIDEAELAHWQAAYPQVCIMLELRKIAAWNEANLIQRKTRSGIRRHINGWLNAAQEKNKSDDSSLFSSEKELL